MALIDDVRHLASVPALAGLEPDALRLIAFSGESRILRTGDVLFRRDDVSDGGYVVLSGAVALGDGGARGTTLVRAPGLIGATALLVETRRPTSAVAREASSVLKISRDLFRRVLSEHPRSARRLEADLLAQVAALGEDLAATRRTLLGDETRDS